MTFASSCDSVEFIFGYGYKRSGKFNKLAHEELMANFEDYQWYKELDWNTDPEKCILLALIVAVNTSCSSENCDKSHEP